MSEFDTAYEAAWDVLRFVLSDECIKWWCSRPSYLLADEAPEAVFAASGETPVREAAHLLATALRERADV